MATHDMQGREYARLSMLKEGDMVKLDDDFTCALSSIKTIYHAPKDNTLYFLCDDGEHYLEGQLSYDNESNADYFVGIYGPL